MVQARVFLERQSELANNYRSCRLVVDDVRGAEVPLGRSLRVEVAPGERSLRVDLDETVSNEILVTLAEAEDVVLQCGSPGFMPRDVGEVLAGLHLPYLLWPAFDLALAWFTLGRTRARRAESLPALHAFEQGSTLRPWDPLGPLWIGRLRRMLGLEGAREALERALELRPDHAPTILERGRLLAGDPAPALRDFERALELDPDLGEAHHERALALQALGRKEEAVAALDQAIGRPGVCDDALALRRALNAELGRRDPSDAEFGRLFLEAYRRQSKGYDGLPYDFIQRLKALDREGFVRFVAGERFAKLTERELLIFSAAPPEVVARGFRDGLLRMQGPEGGHVLSRQHWIEVIAGLPRLIPFS